MQISGFIKFNNKGFKISFIESLIIENLIFASVDPSSKTKFIENSDVIRSFVAVPDKDIGTSNLVDKHISPFFLGKNDFRSGRLQIQSSNKGNSIY